MKYCQIVYIDPLLDKELILNILSERFDLKTISLNELFRNQLKIESLLTNELRDCMDKGLVVPIQLTEQLIELEIDKINGDILLVSYPRTTQQLESLKRFLETKGLQISIIWYFKHADFDQFLVEYHSIVNQKLIGKYGTEINKNWLEKRNRVKT